MNFMSKERRESLIEAFKGQIKALNLKPNDWTDHKEIKLGERVMFWAESSMWVSSYYVDGWGRNSLSFVMVNGIEKEGHLVDIDVPFEELELY